MDTAGGEENWWGAAREEMLVQFPYLRPKAELRDFLLTFREVLLEAFLAQKRVVIAGVGCFRPMYMTDPSKNNIRVFRGQTGEEWLGYRRRVKAGEGDFWRYMVLTDRKFARLRLDEGEAARGWEAAKTIAPVKHDDMGELGARKFFIAREIWRKFPLLPRTHIYRAVALCEMAMAMAFLRDDYLKVAGVFTLFGRGDKLNVGGLRRALERGACPRVKAGRFAPHETLEEAWRGRGRK